MFVFFCNEREGGKTYKGDIDDFMGPCGVPLGNCFPIEGLSNPPAAAGPSPTRPYLRSPCARPAPPLPSSTGFPFSLFPFPASPIPLGAFAVRMPPCAAQRFRSAECVS